jgi:hypothetical protein
MRRSALVLLVLLAVTGWARHAVIETRTGQSYEGHVRVESNGVVVANVERNLLLRVAATNLLALRFRHDPAAEVIPDYLRGSVADSLPGPWQSQDIGSALTPGNVTVFAGFYCVRTSGTNIAAEGDSFHFVCKPVQGRSDLVARLQSVPFTHPLAQAGLMVRENLSSSSPHVFVGLTPSRTGLFQWRSSEGGDTTSELRPKLALPCWLRLKRDGSAFAAYSSRDGRRWSLVHTTSVQMAEFAYVGLAVSSGREDRVQTSTFDQVNEAPWLWTSPITPRVELRSGSVMTGLIRSVDDTAVYFWGAPPRDPVATRAVSRIVFQWLGPRESAKLQSGRPGVLLRTGEFVEGDFRGLQHGVVQISSVLLGLRRFDAEGEVAVITLRKPAATLATLAATTADGSVWLGKVTGLGDGEIFLQEASLGLCRIPTYALTEVRFVN